MSPASNKSKRQRRFFAAFALLLFTVGLAIPALWFDYVNTLPDIDIRTLAQPSPIILDRNGQLMRAYAAPDGLWRLPVDLKDVDPKFIAALIAYEDHRFYRHGAVDPGALLRAAGQWLARGHIVSGGSTLSMQVARLIEPRQERSIQAKLRQIARAEQLERRYSKQEILRLYLALAPYGGNLVGIRAASLAYFGKEPKRFLPGEIALLVALPQSPESLRPDHGTAAAKAARARVASRVYRYKVFSIDDIAQVQAEPLSNQRRAFPALAAHAADEARKAEPDQTIIALTFERGLQASMENLALETAQRLGAKISAAIVVIDNETGEIRARVGNADYLSQSRAGSLDMSRAVRSPGSALKPFIYAMAFELGIAHPETILDDRPLRYGLYAPKNFDLTFRGAVTARLALQNSLNLPTIELLNEIGPDRFLVRMRNTGVKLVLPADSMPGLAIGIGGIGIQLVDLAYLYVGLARGGSLIPLNERLNHAPVHVEKAVVEPAAAWYVTDILRGVPPPTNSLAGRFAFKTGTSYGYRDAFAVGYDKRYTVAVWLGRADNGAIPGLIARRVAAPVLFDAFARLSVSGASEFLPPPKGILRVKTSQLPPPLRNLRKDVARTLTAGNSSALKIAYPPDGALVELFDNGPDYASLALKAQGGTPPFIWLVNGMPLGTPNLSRESFWRPDGVGFARITLMDASGGVDSVSVRLN